MLLKVGCGEVDDELEEEVGSECAKWDCDSVLIFENAEPNFPSDEAVSDLEGRFVEIE